MECRELTALALDGKLSDAPGPIREEVAAHCEGCAACRAELETLENAWARLGEDADLPVTPEFGRRTLALLEDEMLRSRIRAFSPGRTRHWTRPALQAAALLVAAVAGFAAARQLPSPSAGRPSEKTASTGVPQSLGKASGLANVAYRPADAQGRIGVSFDVTSRETVVGRPDDPQMARLIAFLVSRGAQTAGERSRAIDLVSANYGVRESPASPDIVLALTNTLKKDQNPGVRKKAADALAGFRMTPEIRAAFLDALRTDRHPGVRLVAVEALAAAAKDSPDRKTIESLREKAFDPAENGFVRARAASALKGIEF